MLIKLALKSLHDRKGSVILSIIAMTVSVFVLLGVEHVRHQTKQNFANTVSGVDLIVGARTSSLNLLLYSVFKIGSPSNNISWQSFKKVAENPQVKWAVPLSLGDSHKGYRVLGTTESYFQYYSYGKKHKLLFQQGQAFNNVFDVVLGYQIAVKLGYQLGDEIVLAHGLGRTSFSMHADKPFTVVGILAPTGTPVDHTLHVSLQAIEAIHASGKNTYHASQTSKPDKRSELKTDLPPQLSANYPSDSMPSSKSTLTPKSITAFMLGLNSKMSTFKIQREINNNRQEPLSAILPGVALSELWQIMGILESTLFLVAILVFISASLGVSAMLLSAIKQRSREMYLLRVIGAPALFLFMLIELEALFITIISCALGVALLIASLFSAQTYLASYFSLQISLNIFSLNSLTLIMAMIAASALVATIPSVVSYLQSKRHYVVK